MRAYTPDLQKLLTFEATEKLLNSNILSCEFTSTDSSKMCDISCGKLREDVKLKKVAKSEKMFSKVGRRGMFQQCQHTQDKEEGADARITNYHQKHEDISL